MRKFNIGDRVKVPGVHLGLGGKTFSGVVLSYATGNYYIEYHVGFGSCYNNQSVWMMDYTVELDVPYIRNSNIDKILENEEAS